jgi:hypothetical protein
MTTLLNGCAELNDSVPVGQVPGSWIWKVFVPTYAVSRYAVMRMVHDESVAYSSGAYKIETSDSSWSNDISRSHRYTVLGYMQYPANPTGVNPRASALWIE